MEKVLYQQYRPQRFGDVVGQPHIKKAIQNQLMNGRIAHSYLFCGPRAVGKTTIARLLAKSANCENRRQGDYEPCNECLSCKEIMEGRSIDVIEIDAASHTGVDNVRENIIANARVSPSKSKNKIFIIDEVHMLSISAFNALLKTLEEPPSGVIFILATTEIHKVPTTIISRCQRYDFKKIAINEIIKQLSDIVSKEGKEVELDILKNIAFQSEGCLRDAESLLGQVLFLEGTQITSEMVELIIPKSNLNSLAELVEYLSSCEIEKAIYLVNDLIKNGVDLKTFIKDLLEFLRKIILVKIGGKLENFGLAFEKEIEERILEMAKNFEMEEIVRLIELFLEAGDNLKRTEILSLPLELAILKFNKLREYDDAINKKEVIKSGLETFGIKERESKKGEDITYVYLEKKLSALEQDNMVKQGIMNEIKNDENLKSSSCNLAIKLGEIQKRWDEVIEKIKNYNHSMAFILKVSKPLSLEGKVLKLSHKYNFHLERIQELKNKVSLEKVLAEIFNADLIVESLLDESLEITQNNSNKGEDLMNGENDNNEAKQGNNLLQDILSEFGGEVIS